MSQLSEFLLARIAEDEEVARRVDASGHRDEESVREFLDEATYSDTEAQARWSTRQRRLSETGSWRVGISPTRVLAKREARRAAVDLFDTAVIENDAEGLRPGPDSIHGPAKAELAYSFLWTLAQPYASHPDLIRPGSRAATSSRLGTKSGCFRGVSVGSGESRRGA